MARQPKPTKRSQSAAGGVRNSRTDAKKGSQNSGPRGRAAERPYPRLSFEETFPLAVAIQEVAGKNPVRRLTLFEHLQKSPESEASRRLIVSAGKYGLIKGGHKAETLELTDVGDAATNKDRPERERIYAQIQSAIITVPIFNQIYEKFKGQKLPATPILLDYVRELGIPAAFSKECVDLLILNLKAVNLLQTLAGADRIVTLDYVLDSLPAESVGTHRTTGMPAGGSIVVHEKVSFDRTCFFIGPIGQEGSEHRRHSDLILEQVVRPIIEEIGFIVKRADEIQNPGLISKQIFEYLLRSRLAIADLSFHNPNVFYELAIRHARNLPTIQIIRAGESIPFDINQSRTIIIDTSSIYNFVPQMQAYKAAIAAYVRQALEDPSSAENPFAVFFPDLLKQ